MGSKPPYRRTQAQHGHDFLNARIWEEEVAGLWPEDEVISRFDSIEDIDLWFPGVYLELKEKNQKYSKRWLANGAPAPEEDLFIIDELTVRRALAHYPSVFFLIRDNPSGGRVFFAPIWELVSVERVRFNRGNKGKWLIDMGGFRVLDDVGDAHRMAVKELAAKRWKAPGAMSEREVPQV